MSIETEDQGDGRSRPHSITVQATGPATVVVQRTADGVYIANFRRIGNCYPRQGYGGMGPTQAEAISAALASVGLEVVP